jgi:hypothetical protein
VLAVPAASARPAGPSPSFARPHTGSATVVKIDLREGRFTRVLNNLTNHPLYITAAACGSSCQKIWPPLLMPIGKTTPLGAPSLGTAKFGTTGRLQVTYKTHRLYTFVSDRPGTVTGNGVGGFSVVQGVP